MGATNAHAQAGRWQPYPAYKPSGVEWLGDIPAHWVVKRLKHVLSLRSGELLPQDKKTFDEGYLVYGANGVIARSSEYNLTKRSIIVGRVGACGEINIAEPPAWISDNALIISLLESQVDFRLAIYVLKALNLGELASKNAQPLITGTMIRNQPFLWCPLEEQRAIAAFLDRETTRLDALIAKKQRLIELLQEKRTALISQAVTKGLDPHVALKDSGVAWLGEIPAHWTIEKLKHLSSRISGRLVYQPAQYFVDEGVPFLFGNNVTESGFVLDNLKYISPEVNQRFAAHALRAGDLVTVRVGDPGVTAVVPPELEGLNCASLMIIRRSPTFVSEWLAYAMNSHIGDYQVDAVQYGAAQEQINITDAVNFVFPVPPLHEQAQIAEYLNHATSRVDSLKRKINEAIERLREYRTALIAAAVTGKIDVRPSPQPSP